MKSSGELKSRGVKLLPGKDNTNKLSLSKSFNFSYSLFIFIYTGLMFFTVSLSFGEGRKLQY